MSRPLDPPKTAETFGADPCYISTMQPELHDGRYLVDAGRSPFGWSRIGTYRSCGVLYALGDLVGYDLSTDQMREGTVQHILQAHYAAQIGAKQGGVWMGVAALPEMLDDGTVSKFEWPPAVVFVDDPEMILEPVDAVKAWARKTTRWDLLADMVASFENWRKEHEAAGRHETERIKAVEWPVTFVVGTHETEGFGIWVVDDEDAQLPLEVLTDAAATPVLHAVIGGEVNPARIEESGHPRDGWPILVTRRLDLIYETPKGEVIIRDHKGLGYVEPRRANRGYCVDGGFQLFNVAGRQTWPQQFGVSYGDCSGVQLNLVGKRPDRGGKYKLAEPFVPPVVHHHRIEARRILDAETQMASMEAQYLDGSRDVMEFPAPVSESGHCEGRYGECPALNVCIYGLRAGAAGWKKKNV